MSTKPDRLRDARKRAGFLSARSAALRFGWSPSTYAAHENGQNDFDWEAALKYSRSFDTDPVSLFAGRVIRKRVDTAPLSGVVTAGGKVDLYAKPNYTSEKIIVVAAPVDISFMYVEVGDGSLWPKFEERDLLMLARTEYGMEFYNLYPTYHLVETESDILFRRVEQTERKGYFDLHSSSAPIIRGARVLRAWQLTGVFSRFSWARQSPLDEAPS